jgi:hypothetical protein
MDWLIDYKYFGDLQGATHLGREIRTGRTRTSVGACIVGRVAWDEVRHSLGGEGYGVRVCLSMKIQQSIRL